MSNQTLTLNIPAPLYQRLKQRAERAQRPVEEEALVALAEAVAGNGTIAEKFETLSRQWKAETAFLSSTTAMTAHPAYRAIITLGPDVVPLLLRDLEREHAHWFEALKVLTGADPVPREQWGNIPAMRVAWLTWGRDQGLI
ncbi:MAG TPA: hypothetical protein VKD72_23805 [Gemmataceae bacterium]|nr:hypothetical protein [Gemmataceae bacterium]